MGNITFSEKLQSLRKERKVTQEQLALSLGVSPQAVSKWENGSFPDGDLVPRIADYFGVSIDCLYGRGNEDKCIEQLVMDAIVKLKEGRSREEAIDDAFEKMLDIIWGMQICMWENNKNYYLRPSTSASVRTASVLTSDSGFAYMKLGDTLPWYMIMKEPEDGFAGPIQISERLRGFYRFLSEGKNLEILMYLLSLRNNEYANTQTISEKLKLPQKDVDKAMDYLSAELSDMNGFCSKLNLVNKNDLSENVYGVNYTLAGLLLAVFSISNELLNPPNGYQMQIGMRTKSFIQRKRQNDDKKDKEE